MHFGKYLEDPPEALAEIIFPQDVRNCTACHTESDSWNENPSRIACLTCHDLPGTAVHASLQTLDPTPAYPYNGDEQEACVTCHGGNSEFAPQFVHNVWDPYAPPYPREPAE